jgi:hypothetical protein
VIGSYLALLCVGALATWKLPFMRTVCSAFSLTRGALISMIMVAATAGSVSLFFSDWLAFALVPLGLIVAVVYLAFSYGKGTVSAVSAALIGSLICLLVAALVLTLLERDAMTPGMATAVGVLLLLFWGLGSVFTAILPTFRNESQPFSKSRTLMMLVVVTMYCLWFAGKYDWGFVAVCTFGFITFLFWLFSGNNKVMSASISLYRDNPQETCFLISTMIFVTTLNLAVSVSKDVRSSHQNVYFFNIVLFAVTMAVAVSGVSIYMLKTLDPALLPDKAKGVHVEMSKPRPSRT